MPSPFDVLGVDPHADEETVERAYKRRVKESHPDHGGSAEEFQAVRAAYEEIITGEVDRYGEAERAEAERDDGPTGGRWRDERESRDTGSDEARVEYLDYECLDDHGWSLDDADLFEKAADADLEDADYGGFLVRADETLLEAAEKRGFAWPYACRGGACANCAVAVTEGELSTPVDHILPEEMVARGIRLSCVGRPTTEELRVVYNIKHLPDLDDLRLPPRPFEQAQAD